MQAALQVRAHGGRAAGERESSAGELRGGGSVAASRGAFAAHEEILEAQRFREFFGDRFGEFFFGSGEVAA